MNPTCLVGTDKYSDMMCNGKKLYIFKVLWPINITHRVIRIQQLSSVSVTNMSSAVIRGLVGTLVAGLPGTVLGVATAKRHLVGAYRLTFEATFDEKTIDVYTKDAQLNAYLYKRAINK